MLNALKSRWLQILCLFIAGYGLGFFTAPRPSPVSDRVTVSHESVSSHSTEQTIAEKTDFRVTPKVLQPAYAPAESHNVRGTSRDPSTTRSDVFDLSTSLVLPDSNGVLFLRLDSIVCATQTIGSIRIVSWFKPVISLDTTRSHDLVQNTKDSSSKQERRDSTHVIREEPDAPLLTSGFSLRSSLLKNSTFGLAAIRPGLFADAHIGKPNRGIRPVSLGLTTDFDATAFSLAHPLDALSIDLNARVNLYWR